MRFGDKTKTHSLKRALVFIIEKIISVFLLLFWDWWHKKILLINYTGDEANHGCMATSRALIRLIREKYSHAAIRVQAIDYKKPERFLFLNAEGIDQLLPEYISHEGRSFDFFKWADVIILNGEGSIHEYDDPTLNQLSIRKLLQVYAGKKIYNKKVHAVNQTIDYVDRDFGRLIKRCYEELDYVTVREPLSLNKAKEIGLLNARLSADAAFLLPEGSKKKAKMLLDKKGIKQDGFVCIFLSETILNCATSKFIRLIKKIKERFNRDILICATSDADVSYMEKVKNHMPVFTMGLDLSPQDLIKLIECAGIVLSGRFHSCIFSFLADTPLLPFCSNTHKIEGLMESMGYPIRVYDYAEDPNDSLLNEMKNVLNNADTLKKNIKAKLPEMKALARLNIL